MEFILNDSEIRVLGCLIEKETTTPEYYPLTLNALVNACNQKSNRDPVVSYDETQAVTALDGLRRKQLALLAGSEGSRAPKYRHFLREKFHLEKRQLALLCELFLRGPQTLGELRNRAGRMADFESLEQVEETLEELRQRTPAMVERMPRQTGQKECRFAQLFSGPPATPDSEPARPDTPNSVDRLSALEEEVAALRTELEELKTALGEFRDLLS